MSAGSNRGSVPLGVSVTHWTCAECGGYANDVLGHLVCVNCGFLARQGYREKKGENVRNLSDQVHHLRTVALDMLDEARKNGLL